MKKHFFIAVDIDPTVLDIFPYATPESVIEATLMSSRFLDNATVTPLRHFSAHMPNDAEKSD